MNPGSLPARKIGPSQSFSVKSDEFVEDTMVEQGNQAERDDEQASEQVRTVDDVFHRIIGNSLSKRQQGTQFELATRFFLRNDPKWQARITDVDMWSEAPAAVTGGKPDSGIDLVAKDMNDGTWWAIQCKCYQKHTINLRDVDSFFATALADKKFGHYLLVDTTDGMDTPLSDLVKGLGDRFARIDLDAMEEANLDWKGFEHHLHDAAARIHERVTFDPRGYQQEAIDRATDALKTADRCTLVMACGTGKTLTALRYTEEAFGDGKVVLYLAPSISLVSQTLSYWANQTRLRINPYVVCSDSKASRLDDDEMQGLISDIHYPATTSAETISKNFRVRDDCLNVIFSTYQSLPVVHEVQGKGALPTFDLTICDEAHRTTGLIREESPFQKVHDSRYLHSRKRLYMTATPRVYSASAKGFAKGEQVEAASMDDPEKYGKIVYTYSFGRAVQDKVLSDYKIIVMNVTPKMIGWDQMRLDLPDDKERDSRNLELSDAAKYVGCWDALFDRSHAEDPIADLAGGTDGMNKDKYEEDHRVLHRVIAFEPTIRDSKILRDNFTNVINAYKKNQAQNPQEGAAPGRSRGVDVTIRHVDGGMNAADRKSELHWLDGKNDSESQGKGEDNTIGERECHILTNARCLAEGVDVPDLDAVIYFSARRSRIDIIQSVGRVMRTAPGKKYGYIIIPIFAHDSQDATDILSSGAYQIVWDVLSALRSNDERLDAKINSLQLGQADALKDVINVETLDENTIKRQVEAKRKQEEKEQDEAQQPGSFPDGSREEANAAKPVQGSDDPQKKYIQPEADLSDDLLKRIAPMVLKHCGSKMYWDEWTDDIARIAKQRTEQIAGLVRDGGPARAPFLEFLEALRNSLNNGYTEDQAIEVLAQHEITRPIFQTLFPDPAVLENSPVVKGLDTALNALYSHGLDRSMTNPELRDMYASVRLAASQIHSDEARQNLVRETYNEFFSKVFRDTSDALGIVYTPVPVVDAQLHMVHRALLREFGEGLGTRGVHVLDGFAGTGTYICRLLEDRTLIPDGNLQYKYEHDLHSNEIVPLASTIMSINIEESYHKRHGGDYQQFPGALLTDTFQMYENGDQDDLDVFQENTRRIREQRRLPIRVFIGNPPYRAGDTEGTGNQNTNYEQLDASIRSTYASSVATTNKNSLYDSYIRAFRWASDRLEKQGRGIICFVSNGGWITSDAGAGIRRSLVEEFNSIYVYNLRGNQRTQGEESRKEGGKIFGSGSRATIAITMLVLNPDSKEHGVIHYKDIGDYLTREQKLDILKEAVDKDPDWTILAPDEYGDWLNKRDPKFDQLIPMGETEGNKKLATGLFSIWSNGLKTQRDAWCYNFSRSRLDSDMRKTIAYFNAQSRELKGDAKAIRNDEKKIHWTRAFRHDIARRAIKDPDKGAIVVSAYRPFCKQWLWFDRQANEMMYQQENLFPYPGAKNLMICLSDTSALITGQVPDLHYVGDSQCFPLYWYERIDDRKLPETGETNGVPDGHGYVRHDAITDAGLEAFRRAYPQEAITKKDIFYYVYGILNSPDYRNRYANNLSRDLPRIPLVEEFDKFRDAGRKLANLHLGYEKADRWPVKEVGDSINPGRTIKLGYPRRIKDPDNPSKKIPDKSVLQVAENLTIEGIPDEAYDFMVNGKTAIGWLVDRYRVTTDKKSGIVNDPNDWSDDPRYIVDLVEKVITVAMRTLEITSKLPRLHEKDTSLYWDNRG